MFNALERSCTNMEVFKYILDSVIEEGTDEFNNEADDFEEDSAEDNGEFGFGDRLQAFGDETQGEEVETTDEPMNEDEAAEEEEGKNIGPEVEAVPEFNIVRCFRDVE